MPKKFLIITTLITVTSLGTASAQSWKECTRYVEEVYINPDTEVRASFAANSPDGTGEVFLSSATKSTEALESFHSILVTAQLRGQGVKIRFDDPAWDCSSTTATDDIEGIWLLQN